MSNSIGDRYIALVTAHGWTENYIYEWNGSSWTETIPNEGDIVFVTDIDGDLVYTAGEWVGPVLGENRFGLEILTHFKKLERVSREIDARTFVASPGIWAKLNSDGSLSNVVINTPAKINKLVIGHSTGNKYENNDTVVGRITTIENFGIRCRASYQLYVGVINIGDRLAVSTAADTLGKLISVEEAYETGTYEVVARAEEAHVSQGYIIFRTVSPEMVTII